MPLQATSGAASYDAFGGGVAAVPNYIEDVFNSYLWTTSGSAQTLTTGIDMTKGALTWIKGRSNAFSHILQTGIGGGVLPDNALSTNSTAAYAGGNYRIADSTTGFTMGTDYYTGTPETAVVWTFRKQPKFFDVVTYTGNGAAGRTVAHNLGSVPGCMFVKKTSGADAWAVYHRGVNSDTGNGLLVLNSTAAQNVNGRFWWGDNTSFIAPTATEFTVATDGQVNENGATYVAYLFAHDAGGFGLTGTDNVISCGSFTTDGSGNFSVNLGYEPQWVIIKSTNNTGVSAAQQNWIMMDNMRGFLTQSGNGARLRANTGEAESTTNDFGPTATGFESLGNMSASAPFIYIAIRRGPMKVPTSGTSVFSPVAYTGNNSSTRQLTSGFPIDVIMSADRSSPPTSVFDRLRGVSSASPVSATASTADEQSSVYGILGMTTLQTGDGTVRYQNSAGVEYIDYFFRRAPSYLDEICYTGNGVSGLVLNHNLTVVPEFIIVKERTNDGIADWSACYNFTPTTYIRDILNRNDSVPAVDTYGSGGNNYAAAPTATTITVGTSLTNANGSTYVAYLFATCAGVSKVGSYTGNGSSQTINCGFTGGARFVMVKATSTTGNWIVADSARGIVAGNDPALYLNSTAAEVTGLDWIDADNSGFVVNETATIAANTNGVSYIFFAVA